MSNSMFNRLNGKQVLVVEDEYLIAADLAFHLNRHGAAVVGPVATVADAQRLADEVVIDCAIIDLNLRGETPYELLDALLRANVAVLIVSGYDPSDIPSRFRDLSFIQKPATLDGIISSTRH